MSQVRTVRPGLIERFLGKLRFPQLFALLATLFFLDMLLPDPIPLLDELMLGALALFLGMWKERQREIPLEQEGEKDISGRARRVD